MAAAPISGQGVFSAPIMARVAYVASPIPRLVSMEVVELLLAAPRQWSMVTVMRIKAVIDVAVKAVGTVKPRASTKKHTANKPIGPIVAERSTVIWGVVEVTIGTNRRRSNADGNLGWPQGCRA
jgi:hypothetical protein